jgi:hypothetical protein
MKELTEKQRRELEKLWFVFGNNGKKHTHCNHRYIQNFLEQGEDTEQLYKQSEKGDLTDECVEEVKKIFLPCQ